MDALDLGQLDDLAREVRESLGDLVVGVYLHGSTARRQLRSRSDLDVLVVTRASLGSSERADLAARLLRLSGRHPRLLRGRRPVELTVVSQPDVRPWRYPPRTDFLYGEWLREEIENGLLPEPGISADLALVLAQVLATDSPLLGPPAGQVLDHVPVADVVAATRHGVGSLLANLDSDTTNVLLTLARAWRTVTSGEIVTKDQAAEWALPRLSGGQQAVVAHARSVYLDMADEDWKPLQSLIAPAAEVMAAGVG